MLSTELEIEMQASVQDAPEDPDSCKGISDLYSPKHSNYIKCLKMYSPGDNNLYHEPSVFTKSLKISCRRKKQDLG